MSTRYDPSPKSPLVESLEPRVLLASGPIPIGDFAVDIGAFEHSAAFATTTRPLLIILAELGPGHEHDFHPTHTVDMYRGMLNGTGGLGAVKRFGTINFVDHGGSEGHYASDVPFSQAGVDDFATLVTTVLDVTSAGAGTWTFGVNTDDGCELKIDGQSVIRDDSRHGPLDRFGQVHLSQGQHTLELLHFDSVSTACLELFAAPGDHSSFNQSFNLISHVAVNGLRADQFGFEVRQRSSTGQIDDLGDARDLFAEPYHSIQGYFAENSIGKLDVQPAWEGEFNDPEGGDQQYDGIVGPYTFVPEVGIMEVGKKRRVAIEYADRDFDFSTYDRKGNNNGVLDRDELLILIVTGQWDGNEHWGILRPESDFDTATLVRQTVNVGGGRNADRVSGTLLPQHGGGTAVHKWGYYAHPGTARTEWTYAQALAHFVGEGGVAGGLRGAGAGANVRSLDQPVTADGITIPTNCSQTAVEQWVGLQTHLHELSHLVHDDAMDIYNYEKYGVQAGINGYAMMGTSYPNLSVHHDPWTKSRIGWVAPTVISSPGWYALRDVETTGEVIRIQRNAQEYFLIENRWHGTSYDAASKTRRVVPGVPLSGLSDEGLAIWHIDETRLNSFKEALRNYQPPPAPAFISKENAGSAATWADDLWDGSTDFHALSASNSHWNDGTASDIVITDISAPGERVRFYVDFTGVPKDRLEPNESLEFAHVLPTGDQVHTGLTMHRNDIDCFRWTAPASGQAEFEIRFSNAIGDLDMVLYREGPSTYTELASSESVSDNESLTWSVTGGKTYLIRIYGYQGAMHTGYDLVIDGPALVVDTDVDESDGDYSLGDLSLREALALAHETIGADVITFAPVLNGRTIQLNPALGELVVDSDVEILGPGADLLTVDADRNSRVFSVSNASDAITAEIAGLSIVRGYSNAGHAGGVYNTETLTVRACAVHSNEATGVGGGIYNSGGTLRVVDSAVHGNSAAQAGGGIHSYGAAGHVSVHNTTISGNWANQWGGGISQHFGALEMVNATVADNTCDWDVSGGQTGGGVASLGGATITLHNTIVDDNWRKADGGFTVIDDISGTVDPVSSYNVIGPGGSGGLSDGVNHNRVGVDAKLGPLADNGGPTPTHKLLPDSPAIDAGKDQWAHAKGLTADQRGFSRFMNIPGLGSSEAVDIGAYEHGLVVTTVIDESDGNHSPGNLSLREALELADARPGMNFIYFDPSIYPGTIILASSLGELKIQSSLHVVGPGTDLLRVDANAGTTHSHRVFRVDDNQPGVTLSATIEGLSITGGYLTTSHGAGISNAEDLTITGCAVFVNEARAGVGGGIYNGWATLTIEDSLIKNNHASLKGGGIDSFGATGEVTILNSTISTNSADSGGGVNMDQGTLVMVNSTVAENWCNSGAGGGVNSGAGTQATLHNTIVARNRLAPLTRDDVRGMFDPASSYNLIGVIDGSAGLGAGFGTLSGTTASPLDPLLAPLADNGGPTQTHALLSNSPAVDAGRDQLAQAKGLTGDQRGVRRFIDILGRGGSETVDIGAYEYDGLEVNVWLVPRVAATSSDTSGSLPTSDRAGSFWQIETCDYTVEVWVRANQVGGPAISDGSVRVTFDPGFAQAMSIDHGSVYTLLPAESIDNTTGTVTLGGATLSTTMGDDEYVCLGRVLFRGDAPVDEAAHNAGPYDMALDVAAGPGSFALVATGNVAAAIQPAPGVDIRANIYDIDDNGQVAFNDFTYFAPAYGGAVGQAEPPFFWWADFDRNGQVAFNDFTYFSPAYMKPFCDPTLSFPSWWNTTYVTRSAPLPTGLDAPAAADEEADANMLTGDFNADGRISGRDRRELHSAYGSAVGDADYTPLADLNVDGRVSGRDRRILRDNYGTAVPDPPALPAAAPQTPAPARAKAERADDPVSRYDAAAVQDVAAVESDGTAAAPLTAAAALSLPAAPPLAAAAAPAPLSSRSTRRSPVTAGEPDGPSGVAQLEWDLSADLTGPLTRAMK